MSLSSTVKAGIAPVGSTTIGWAVTDYSIGNMIVGAMVTSSTGYM